MIRFSYKVILKYLAIAMGGERLGSRELYFKGWNDCLKYLANNFNVDVVVDKEEEL